MNLFLDKNTAQYFWRSVYPANRAPSLNTAHIEQIELTRATCAKSQVDAMAPAWIYGKSETAREALVELLVFTDSLRRKSQALHASVWSCEVPDGSFYSLGSGVFVESPEFLFLRMATTLSPIELIAFGNELCGYYSFDASSPRGFRQRSMPLTTVRQIRTFLEHAQGCRGSHLATRALDSVVNGSASPMETVDEMLLCLPRRMGGYGIDSPHMNYRIDMNCEMANLAARRTCYADLCWPQQRLIVEHQGLRDHASPDGYASDRDRINALKQMGFDVLELTGKHVRDVDLFETTAFFIARRTGKRIPRVDRGHTEARRELRRVLFAWNSRGGMGQA